MSDNSALDKITLMKGDITRQKTDAIVNAANESLLGGGGVDGAIHSSAGPHLLEECRTLGGCPTGEVRLTDGYDLLAGKIIHTVGPVWQGGQQNETGQLASCYRNSLKMAWENGIKSLSFPSISTGVYQFPFEKACRIALVEIIGFLKSHPDFDEVRLVCFSDQDLVLVKEAFAELGRKI
jgi:O-acetyl-ADP-ribose deacetylase